MTQRLHLIRQLRADLRHLTGRDYRIDLEVLDELSVRELMRLLIDFEYEKNRAINNEKMRARRMPWLIKGGI